MTQCARCCLLTPRGRGAIAVIGVCGLEAWRIVSALFLGKNAAKSPSAARNPPLDAVMYGHWKTASGEDVVVCRRTNHVEINCHGGVAAAATILADLRSAGCKEVSSDEWIAAAFPGDPIGVDARLALANCQTLKTAAILLDQLHGALDREIAAIVAAIDVRELHAAAQGIESLRRRWSAGKRLCAPGRVVFSGKPNVGKSSLINAVLGYARSIVHDRPGTTRDLVTGPTAVEGWPVELIDTAGLRESSDPLEAAGIARAHEALRTADVIVHVVDATSLPECGTEELAERVRLAEGKDNHAESKRILVVNKIDLVPAAKRRLAQEPSPRAAAPHAPVVFTSAVTKDGIEGLIAEIARQLVDGDIPPGCGAPFTPGHVRALEAAAAFLNAGELAAARRELLRLANVVGGSS